jgi:hypothetical protein
MLQLAKSQGLPLLQGASALESYRRLARAYLGSAEEMACEVAERLQRARLAVEQLQRTSAPGLAALMQAALPPALAIEGANWGLAPAEAIQYRSRTPHFALWVFAAEPGTAPMLLSPQDSAFGLTRTLTGAQDLQVGDAELDATTIIQGREAEQLQSWLAQMPVLQALRRLRAATPRWRVNQCGAGAVLTWDELNAGEVQARLKDLGNLVRLFPTEPPDGHPRPDRPDPATSPRP